MAGREAAVRRLFGWFVCTCVALAAACAPTPEEKSTAPVVVLVLVDGVQGAHVAEQWAAALGPIAWAGEVGAVSTSTAATLASVLTGEDPPVHGRFSARDYGVELRVPTVARLLRDREFAPFERAVAACDRRELAPEVVGLNGGFDSWTTVAGGELGGALDSLSGEIEAARTRSGGTFALAVESLPRIGSSRRFPSTLAEHLARELTPLVALRSDVPPLTDVAAWYERRWLADEVLGPALERAFAAAHVAAISQRLGSLALELGRHHTDWCITVAVLVPPDALEPETIHTTVPIASAGAPAPLVDVGELIDVAEALMRRSGSAADVPPAEQYEFGLWNANAVVRGVRRSASHRLSDANSPRYALTFENQWKEAVRVVVTATEACMDVVEEAQEPLRKVAFTLEKGASRSVAFDRPSPDLLIELSRDDRALHDHEVVIDRVHMPNVPVMRVLDLRESELGASVEGNDGIERSDDGHLRINGGGRPIADAWPPPADPIVVERDEAQPATWLVQPPPAARLALLIAENHDGSASTREATTGWYVRYRQLDFSFEGRRLEPTALRFMWPPIAKLTHHDSDAAYPSPIAITSTPDMGLAVRVPRELRGLLQSLLPHE